MEHAPAHQSRGDLAAAPQARPRLRRPPRTLRPSGGDAWRAAAHEARTGRPDRSGRPSRTVRPSPVSLVALGPGAAPQTGPICARNPATNAPVYPKESVPDSRWWSGVRLDRSGVVAGVVVTPDTDRGGGQEKRRVGVRQPHSVFPCVCSCFSSCTGRDVTLQPTRRGRERPPLFCRWRGSSKGAVSAQVSGTVSDPTTRLLGRSRPYVSLRPAQHAQRASPGECPLRPRRPLQKCAVFGCHKCAVFGCH